ncbi:MAG: ATP-binding protein [Armatimonadota bacterium]
MTPLIGQENPEALLARALAQDRVGHAYLLLGPSGSGKASLGVRFAAALCCSRQPAAALTGGRWRLAPCQECESCRRVAAGTHPEVVAVLPDSKTGQDISVAQARLVRQNAALAPKLGTRRVYLLPNAEALNEVSANALLKTLEEPAAPVTLVLCAPNPSQVLPTIRSRCQTVRLGLVPAAEIELGLVSRGVPTELAPALARACGGCPGLAMTWAEDPTVLDRRRAVLDVFVAALRAQAAGQPSYGVLALRLAEQLRKLGEAEKDDEGPARPAKVVHAQNLDLGLTFLRDLLLLRQGADPSLSQNQDRVSQLIEMAIHAEPARILDDIEVVREAQQLLDRNVTPQLVLERMFWALISGRIPLYEPLFD